MYRDVLVHVNDGEGDRHLVEFAVDLTTRFRAHLNGLHVTPVADVPPLYKPSQIATAVCRRSAALASDALAARLAFETLAVARLASTAWFATVGAVAEGVAARARYADPVIIGQGEWQEPVERHPRPVAHSVAMLCGRPVLLVPAGITSAEFTRIAVAWDGSREAVRAIHDAIPLLRSATTVHLLTVVKESDDLAAADAKALIAHLANHEISAESVVLRAAVADEHKALYASVEQGAYDLLVMGAYSHARWVEFIFGGATRSMLQSSNIPVLVSH